MWFAFVSEFAPWLTVLESVLSVAERARADACRTEHLRTACVVRHGLLRMILGRQWGTRAADIEFERTLRGKPFCPGASQSFSVSHSGDLAVFAVGSTPWIGVDVEKIRPIPEFEELALCYFSTREYRSLLALPPTDRERGFLACWTAKEAILKATGEGIYGGLVQAEVSVSCRPAAILRIESENTAEWRLRSFVPLIGYLAAVAVKQPELHLRYRSLNPEPVNLLVSPAVTPCRRLKQNDILPI